MIQVLQYKGLHHWAVSHPTEEKRWDSNYSVYLLGDLMHRVIEPVTIQDNQIYTRLTIKMNGAGAEVRKKRGIPEKIAGKDIGRKNQFVVHTGQLVVSSIDARNGAIGIVPADADESIVTDNFWVFEVDGAQVIPAFLQQVLARPLVTKQIAEKSHGTTNRLYITLDQFLKISIPLPSMDSQRELLKKLNDLKSEADKLQEEVDGYASKRDEIIAKSLGEIPHSGEKRKGHLFQVQYRNMQKWSTDSENSVRTKWPTVKMSDTIVSFMEQGGVSLRINPMDSPSQLFHYIGMDSVEKETGLLKRNQDKRKGSEIKSASLKVPQGYVIYGKLRPYLNKFWKNDVYDANAICSAEFLVFCPSERLNTQYFLAMLGSQYLQKQIAGKVSGARMPRLSATDFKCLDIPEPDKKIQESIGENVKALQQDTLKKKILIERLGGQEKELLFNSYGL